MDIVIAGFFILGSLIVGIVGNLIASEIYDRSPRLANWLIGRAIERLPEHQRPRYREEWSAHLDECPGKLGKIWHAIGCSFSASAVAKELCVEAPKAAQKNEFRLGSVGLVLVSL